MTSRRPLLALLLAGCTPAPPVGAPILDPPPAGQGLQLEMVSTVDAGQEIERCRFFQVGPEGLWIRREQTRFTAGSHHLLLYSTPYTSIPTMDSQGRAADTRGIVDCADGAPADWNIDGVLGGSQTAAGTDLTAPDGVALHLPPNAVVLMNTHYLNASPHAETVTARINLWGSPAANGAQEAGVMFFYNFYIRVPPNGSSTARMRCPIPRDVTLLNAQSHMHARGVGYAADLLDAGGKVQSELYRNQSWSDVPVKDFSPGLPLPAGSAIDYRCDYQSHEARTILQGFKTRDEMCMFIGIYYPRDLQLERCALDDSFYTSDLAAVHVGDGTATCGATLDCIEHAPHDDGGDADTACRLAACPAGADALFAVEHCRMTNADHACDDTCAMRGPACDACITDKCAPAVGACRQAGC
jgi:hypothetical protein